MTLLTAQGTPIHPQELPLFAKDGWSIPNEIGQEWNPIQRREIVKFAPQLPSARLRSVSGVYNCAGLVFASRRTVIYRMELLYEILRHDGYRKIGPPPVAMEGDVVIYVEDDTGQPAHIGIIMKIEPRIADATFDTTVLSKWGLHGEYIHRLECVPEIHGKPKEFWSERVV